MNTGPRRIVCLSAEAADWLWRIGAWERVAGITAFFNPPSDAAPKPRVSGFSTAHLGAIERLNPDLVITFSDVQAGLAMELMKRGFPVLATNQRTLAETEETLGLLARIVDREKNGEHWLEQFREQLKPVEATPSRPLVYFEEWNDPLISGIGWVSELIERAGGSDVFAELGAKRAAVERVVTPEQVRTANPEIILASWCGKPVQRDVIEARPGWREMSAVRSGQIHEIPGEDVLQPGFRLVNGYTAMKRVIASRNPADISPPRR